MKLSHSTVATLKLAKGKAETIIFDDDIGGFGLRIRRGGSRTWIFEYKLGAKGRRMTLGSLAALSPAQARKTAGELHAMVRLGRDPAGEKAEGRARAAETMGAALQSYLPYKQTCIRPGSYDEVARHLAKHCKPLHGLHLSKIDRRTVAALMATIATNSGAVAANRTRASLAAFFTWAIREGLAEANPVAGTGRRPERSRDRVLSLDELKVIWNALEDDDFGAIMKLLVLTAQRANEIAALRWAEIGDGRIVLPPARTKNNREHVVPLSPLACAILERPRRGEFVFGRDEGHPFSGWSKCKERLDARIADAGEALAPWIVHDIRRSAATGMAALGVQPHVIEAALNHVSGHKAGVAGIYNRSTYDREVRAALALWADHIRTLVDGGERTVLGFPQTAQSKA